MHHDSRTIVGCIGATRRHRAHEKSCKAVGGDIRYRGVYFSLNRFCFIFVYNSNFLLNRMRNMATMSRWFRPLFSTPPHELGKLQPAATLLGRRPFMRRADPQHPQGVGGTASIPQVEERIMFRRIEIVAVPPATAQRLEQGNGISEAIGLRLNAR